MTIIVFLIDTSASMNQRGYLGGRPTLLDVAKGAVETFVKVGLFDIPEYDTTVFLLIIIYNMGNIY